eukprot:CAMPEP_0185577940 /NCGR_PEP_ID=MMETSP0434-20130131/11532_1 /TAXON_ID=626734 ORGANISM="Favella taraikaensis, Strain Fe Narragansett Bay" /NCGR_SAMPLE_ID=MMETSP0434 /ASSEMBLY_ACC=CAM_ASM_000379 /LENGTH=66 /DNA_ID=CAMNT_0028195639 /DNA_START=231 /DNA_END=431 /DNA_ORIENTATION=+
MRSAIEENTNGPLTIDECLIGVVDDYLDSFDGQNQKLLSMFEKNNQHWQKKIDSDGAEYEQNVAKI